MLTVESLNLDHYLEILRRKPGALPSATATHGPPRESVGLATHVAIAALACDPRTPCGTISTCPESS